jgi:hypothetical protein
MATTEELKEVVATFRPLVQSEETRSNNLNTRAAAVLSASGIVTTVLGFFAKDLYTENYKTFSSWFEWVVVLLVVGALLALLGTAACCLKVLLPRTRFAYSLAHVEEWAGRPPQTNPQPTATAPPGIVPGIDELLRRSAHELGWIYVSFRPINNSKANWLERAYMFLAAGISIVVLAAVLVALYSGATEPA